MIGATLTRRDMGRLATGLVAASVFSDAMSASLSPALAASSKGPLPQMKAELAHFASSPFPYVGNRPDTGGKFLDVSGADGRRGHTAPRGGVYYEDQTYSDNRVLLALPAGFDLGKAAAIVVYFHGNQSTLQRDVIGREHVLDQLQSSTLNAAFVAPQFAVDALDSSAGHFWQANAFSRFMAEAAKALADMLGTPDAKASFKKLPIILVAFSGGYNPAAYAVTVGGVGKRVMGLVLLDALYAEIDRFAGWIGSNRRTSFFLSAYSEAAEDENLELQRMLTANGIAFSTAVPKTLQPGRVAFLSTPGIDHVDYITSAWVDNPLTWIFNHTPGLSR